MPRQSVEPNLGSRLSNLRLEHSDLDSAIKALEEGGPANELQIKRLKKRKLQLKDEIVRIEVSRIVARGTEILAEQV